MKAKIIIVEDHEPIRNELKILLSKYGYEIIVLDRFDTVVEDCLREDVDLILLDINLPFYDGYYVCRAIREKSEVPIIVVTSRDSEMDELMSINLGADDFITKPYNTQILLARISAMLKRTHKEKVNDFLQYQGLKLQLNSSTVIYKDFTQSLISCLVPRFNKLPSVITASGADSCNSFIVLPNPLPPDVAKSTIFLPPKS